MSPENLRGILSETSLHFNILILLFWKIFINAFNLNHHYFLCLGELKKFKCLNEKDINKYLSHTF